MGELLRFQPFMYIQGDVDNGNIILYRLLSLTIFHLCAINDTLRDRVKFRIRPQSQDLQWQRNALSSRCRHGPTVWDTGFLHACSTPSTTWLVDLAGAGPDQIRHPAGVVADVDNNVVRDGKSESLRKLDDARALLQHSSLW